jgi:putative sterol carrier protein
MATFPFLSNEWIGEAHKIREEYEGRGATVPHRVRMNLVVTEVPFGTGDVDAHLDTSDGALKLELGHIEPVDLTVTLDYATAKAVLVEGNPQAAMQAFMAGRVRIDGDMSKLMAMQGGAPDATAVEVAQRLRDITE